jgi:hypothetical protein
VTAGTTESPFKTAGQLLEEQSRTDPMGHEARLRRLEERVEKLQAGQDRLARWNQSLQHQASVARKSISRPEGT